MNVTHKKVLFIIWSYTSGGGAEIVLNTLIDSLSKYNYDIDVLEYWHADSPTKHNKNINRLYSIVDSNKECKFIKIIKMILVHLFPFILRKKYAPDKYDIEISFNYMIPTFLLKKDTKKIAWIHGDIYELSHKKIMALVQKKYLNRVSKIVAISKNTYNSILSIYPTYNDKTIIINNSYDFDNIISKSNEIAIEKNKNMKQLLYLGRFDDNKNPLFMVEVLKKLKNDNVKLLYIGRGELKDCLVQKIKDSKLEKQVEIIDYQSNPYPYIKNSDILVCCSKSEGFPTVLVEGMILGKPFVSTNVGGTEELSNNDKCGLVANNVNDFAKKLNTLLNNNNLYKTMSNNCTEFVQKYSKECQGKIVNDLIKNEFGE